MNKAHLEGRKELVWFSRKGGSRVKSMSKEHIINTKEMINRKTTDNPMWCGHHLKEWNYVFNAELKFRDLEEKSLISEIKKTFHRSPIISELWSF